MFDSLISRLIKYTHLYKGNRPHVLFRIIQKIFKIYLKLQNQLKIYGKENVPKNGTIFYLNHPGAYDPIILLAALGFQTGALVAWNYSWFMNMINHYYGFITKIRYESRETIVEKMVRQILTRNRYFSIWPEGGPDGTGLVRDGFSSVVRLYSVINCKEDKIPFTPVLIRGGGVYLHKPGVHRGPIEIHFMKPFFLDREWLKKPDEGGKSPREIIDWMMLKIANKQNQPIVAKNRGLEQRRNAFQLGGKGSSRHQKHHINHLLQYNDWRNTAKFNNAYKIIIPTEKKSDIQHNIEENTVEKYVKDISNIHKSKEFHEIYHEIYHFRCKCSKSRGTLILDEYKFIMDEETPYDLIRGHCKNCSKEYTFIHDISGYYSRPSNKKE